MGGQGPGPRLSRSARLKDVEALRKEVRALKRRLDGIDARYLAVKKAEERWRPSLRERDRLLFANDAGDVARIPRALARLIAEDRAFDGQIVDAGPALRFEQDGEVIAEVPKSLVTQLRGLLVRQAVAAGVPSRDALRAPLQATTSGSPDPIPGVPPETPAGGRGAS